MFTKQQVSEAFLEIADRLVASGEKNKWRIGAYKRAAALVLKIDLDKMTAQEIAVLPGVGDGLAEKILTLREKGTHPVLEELRAQTTLKERIPRAKAEKIFTPVVNAMRLAFPDAEFIVCGSYRRGRETLKDVDVLAVGEDSGYSDFFRRLGTPMNTGASATAILVDGIQIDLRVVPKKSRGCGILWLSGPASFNIRCRAMAKRFGYKLDQYALTDEKGQIIESENEKKILDLLGVGWVEYTDRI